MSKVFIIAEIAQAHEGSLGIAHSYIDALSETGVDAVKFQTHIAEAESSVNEEFRINFSYEDKTRYDYWKRMEFSYEEWMSLKKHCEDKELEFISSPFSCKAVDLLEKVGVSKYKIGSGEVNNLLLLDKICRTNKDILLSSGLSSFKEIDNAIDFINQKKTGNKVSLFQCTSMYPTPPSDWKLNLINKFIKRYNFPIGYSDHSGDIFASLAAVSLGAKLIEFHAVFDKKMFGPDSSSSLNLKQIKNLVKGIRMIESSISIDNEKKDFDGIHKMKNLFEKSLCINKNQKKGEFITVNEKETKKPKNQGINANQFKKIIGKKINKNKEKWSFLNNNDLE